MEKKKLAREVQCAKCPWKKSTKPHDIPNGYSEENHCSLKRTIAEPGGLNFGGDMHVMACHESEVGEEHYCIGWLFNQLGPGNNIGLRLQMMDYDLRKVRTVGPQHERFEDTLPKGKKNGKGTKKHHDRARPRA